MSLFYFCIQSVVKHLNYAKSIYSTVKIAGKFVFLQLEKGKFHGSMDTGLSVIVYKRKGRRIDVDADDVIYHLKVNYFLNKQ